MDALLIVIASIAAIVVLDLLAVVFGADSRDAFDEQARALTS